MTKRRTLTLDYYADGGHSWLKVPLATFKRHATEIADQISKHSYMTTEAVFLEEDRDAGIFLEWVRSNGTEVIMKGNYTFSLSRVRTYAPYHVYFVQNPLQTGSKVYLRGHDEPFEVEMAGRRAKFKGLRSGSKYWAARTQLLNVIEYNL